MKSPLIIFITLLVFSCSREIDYQNAISLNEKQYLEKNPKIIDYLNKRLGHENSISLYESNKCYLLPGGGVTLVMMINKQGTIDLVLAEKENSKTECYRKTYLGTKYEKPEVFPLYVKAQMDYKSK
ncbi:MAG: hypothetical protein V4660_07720 [Pseudomonadota bacterium]